MQGWELESVKACSMVWGRCREKRRASAWNNTLESDNMLAMVAVGDMHSFRQFLRMLDRGNLPASNRGHPGRLGMRGWAWEHIDRLVPTCSHLVPSKGHTLVVVQRALVMNNNLAWGWPSVCRSREYTVCRLLPSRYTA